MYEATLKHLVLKKDEDGGYPYYFSAEYRIETDKDVTIYKVPKIRLPIQVYGEPIIWSTSDGSKEINMGFGEYLKLEKDTVEIDGDVFNDIYCAAKLYPKTIDMTLEEIEKKLGHKVRIVKEKDGKDADVSC